MIRTCGRRSRVNPNPYLKAELVERAIRELGMTRRDALRLSYEELCNRLHVPIRLARDGPLQAAQPEPVVQDEPVVPVPEPVVQEVVQAPEPVPVRPRRGRRPVVAQPVEEQPRPRRERLRVREPRQVQELEPPRAQEILIETLEELLLDGIEPNHIERVRDYIIQKYPRMARQFENVSSTRVIRNLANDALRRIRTAETRDLSERRRRLENMLEGMITNGVTRNVTEDVRKHIIGGLLNIGSLARLISLVHSSILRFEEFLPPTDNEELIQERRAAREIIQAQLGHRARQPAQPVQRQAEQRRLQNFQNELEEPRVQQFITNTLEELSVDGVPENAIPLVREYVVRHYAVMRSRQIFNDIHTIRRCIRELVDTALMSPQIMNLNPDIERIGMARRALETTLEELIILNVDRHVTEDVRRLMRTMRDIPRRGILDSIRRRGIILTEHNILKEMVYEIISRYDEFLPPSDNEELTQERRDAQAIIQRRRVEEDQFPRFPRQPQFVINRRPRQAAAPARRASEIRMQQLQLPPQQRLSIQQVNNTIDIVQRWRTNSEIMVLEVNDELRRRVLIESIKYKLSQDRVEQLVLNRLDVAETLEYFNRNPVERTYDTERRRGELANLGWDRNNPKCREAFDMIMQEDVNMIDYLNAVDEEEEREKTIQMNTRIILFTGESPEQLTPYPTTLGYLLNNLLSVLYSTDCTNVDTGNFFMMSTISVMTDAILQIQLISRYSIYLSNLIDVLRNSNSRVFAILPLYQNGQRVHVERSASVGNLGGDPHLRGSQDLNFVSGWHCQEGTNINLYGIYACEGRGDNPLFPICLE